MRPQEVLDYFKSCHYFKKKTGMSASSLWNWLHWGYIPFESQMKIQEFTKGDLLAIWEHGKK